MEREGRRVGARPRGEFARPAFELPGDPLEPDQRLDAANAVAGADGLDERGRDEGLDHDRGVRSRRG